MYVRNNMDSLVFAAQYGEEFVLDFTFVSQYRDDISEPYKPTGELGLCTIMVKSSTHSSPYCAAKPRESMLLRTYTSVSYTHLDVYKRQVHIISVLYPGIINLSIFTGSSGNTLGCLLYTSGADSRYAGSGHLFLGK